jgi:mRNA-degrading endonuclease RelE of RelBE toxin-antitoxin system
MGTIFKEEIQLPEFERDLKQLTKKYRSLPEDLKTLITFSLNLFHKLNQNQDGIELIAGLGIGYPKIYKVTKFTCKALKGRGAKSGIRVIYAYYPDLDKVEFVEMYFKADQENEDRSRIHKLYKK